MGRFGERIQSVYHSRLGIDLGDISDSISMILLEVMAPHLRRAIHIWSVWLFSPFPHFPISPPPHSPLPTFGPHPIVPNMLHVNSNLEAVQEGRSSRFLSHPELRPVNRQIWLLDGVRGVS